MKRSPKHLAGRMVALLLLLAGGCGPLAAGAGLAVGMAQVITPDDSPDGCTWDGAYYDPGRLHPTRSCRVCEPRNGWAPRRDGARCGDGGHCEDAACIGSRGASGETSMRD